MYVWIIVCMDAHIASALDFGQIAQTGLQNCVTALTALTASILQQHNEAIKRATPDQATRPLQEMNCTDFQGLCVTRFSQYAILAQFQSHLINGTVETAQGGGI